MNSYYVSADEEFSNERIRDEADNSVLTSWDITKKTDAVEMYKEVKYNKLHGKDKQILDNTVKHSVRNLFSNTDFEKTLELILKDLKNELHGRQINGTQFVIISLEDTISISLTKPNQEMNEDGPFESFLGEDKVYELVEFEQSGSEIEYRHYSRNGTKGFRNFLGKDSSTSISSKDVKVHLTPAERKFENTRITIEGELSEVFEFIYNQHDKKNPLSVEEPVIQNLSDLEFKNMSIDNGWNTSDLKSIIQLDTIIETNAFSYLQSCLEQNIVNYSKQTTIAANYSSRSNELTNSEYISTKKGISDNEGNEIVNRETFGPSSLFYDVINDNISLSSARVEDFVEVLGYNGESEVINLLGPPKNNPLEVGNVTFYNVSEDTLTEKQLHFLEECLERIGNSKDNVQNIVRTVPFIIYLQDNLPPENYLNYILTEVLFSLEIPKNKISHHEDKIVEYKSGDRLKEDGSTENIVKQAQEKIPKDKDLGVLIWGISEKTKEVDPIEHRDRLDDDDMRKIERKLESDFGEANMFQFPIEKETEETHCCVLVVTSASTSDAFKIWE